MGTHPPDTTILGGDVAQVVDGLRQLRQLWVSPSTGALTEAVRTGIARRRLVIRPYILDAHGNYTLTTRRARSAKQVTRDYDGSSGNPGEIQIAVGYADRGGVGTPTLVDLDVAVVAGNSTVRQAWVTSLGVLYVRFTIASGEVGAVLRVRAVDDLHFAESATPWDLDAAKPRLDQEIYVEF